jgi:hypothetical protein
METNLVGGYDEEAFDVTDSLKTGLEPSRHLKSGAMLWRNIYRRG